MVIADSVYAAMAATSPFTVTAADEEEKVYAPLLLLIPAITADNENEASTPKVFETWDTDW
jgi:hypothetical protein